jgi:hypothetical protein
VPAGLSPTLAVKAGLTRHPAAGGSTWPDHATCS